MKTADLIDAHADELTLIHLPFRKFGTKTAFAGPAQTIKCFEDNTLIRAELEKPGDGRVLVIDAAGSTRVAVIGDILAGLAISNGWAGIVLNGAIRDSAEIDLMDTAIAALGTSPVKSAKQGAGQVGIPIALGGTKIAVGDWIYGDADGVLSSHKPLAMPSQQ